MPIWVFQAILVGLVTLAIVVVAIVFRKNMKILNFLLFVAITTLIIALVTLFIPTYPDKSNCRPEDFLCGDNVGVSGDIQLYTFLGFIIFLVVYLILRTKDKKQR